MVKQTYIAPGNVLSPRAQWTLFRVLYDGGESNGSLPGYSVAVGDWSGRRCIAVRWNGNADNPIGNPQSRGLPTWFVVPEELQFGILATLAPDVQAVARMLLAPAVAA